MQQNITKWCKFFQGLIFTKFYQAQDKAFEILIWIVVGHLFRLYNPNQLADTLSIPKSSLYINLAQWSLPQWQRFLLETSCQQAYEEIQKTQIMSSATKSRRRITIAVDDTVLGRNGKCLSYCYNWFSGRVKKTIKGQNILGVIIKIGDSVFPLCVRLVPKQGRANTTKPDLLKVMLNEIKEFFSSRGIDITDYPITFDSWYGSQPLRSALEEMGFDVILIHAKSNYVFTINGKKAKLSVHKKEIELEEEQWGCSKPCKRVKAESPTFGKLILLLFRDCSQNKCMMVFGRPLRAAEILSIWKQHHGIEHFWRNLKSVLCLSEMSLHGTSGAYASLGVKVLAYLLMLKVKMKTGLSFHQIQVKLSGELDAFWEIIEHFQQTDCV